jgi:sodium/bile acid cotransporter 7
MGVPLINVLFQTGDPGTVGVLATPLLLYHIEQLILGNIDVEILKKWVRRGREQDDIEKQQQEDQQQSDHADDHGGIPIRANHGCQDNIIYESGTTHVPSSFLPSHLAQSNIPPHPYIPSHLEKEC